MKKCMSGFMKFGAISVIALLPLIFIAFTVLPVTGLQTFTHTSSADLNPEWSASGQTMHYDVTITNNGPDDVDEVRIYLNTSSYDEDFFVCEEKTGWEKYYISVLDACFYVENGDKIVSGESETFSFSARTSDDPNETCQLRWKFETRDEKNQWQFIYDDTSIDSEKPEITKQVIGPQVGECPPVNENDTCWVMNNETQIVVQVTDEIHHKCNSGIDYCYYQILLDGNLQTTEFLNPSEPELSMNWTVVFTEDSVHTLNITCVDIAGNVVNDTEVFRVDSTPPVTEKTFIGPQKFDAGIEWINGVTNVSLSAVDPDITTFGCAIGLDKTWYTNIMAVNDFAGIGVYNGDVEEMECWDPANYCKPVLPSPYEMENEPGCIDEMQMVCIEWNNISDFNFNSWEDCVETLAHVECGVDERWHLYDGTPIEKDKESCHIFQYFSVDHLGNKENMKANCFFVDKTAPAVNKNNFDAINDTNEPAFMTDLNPYGEFHWLTTDMPIEFSCDDSWLGDAPHPAGDEELCFAVSYDYVEINGTYDWGYITDTYCDDPLVGDFCCVDATVNDPFTFKFKEESMHNLEYYCKDAVEKKSPVHKQYYKVDDTPPAINYSMIGDDHLGTCPPVNENDTCYVKDSNENGVSISVEDGGDICAVDDVYCYWEFLWNGTWFDGDEFSEYSEVIFDRDSTHVVKVFCEDALGNDVTDYKTYKVDSLPPVTTKTYGEPIKVWPPCIDQHCKTWITNETPITLSAEDAKVGVNKTFWKQTIVSNQYCENPMTYCHCASPQNYEGPWNEYDDTPFTLTGESCHMIEYYSNDLLGNFETIQAQCVYVDLTPPVGEKLVGDPKIVCEANGTEGNCERIPGALLTCYQFNIDECAEVQGCSIEVIGGSCGGEIGCDAYSTELDCSNATEQCYWLEMSICQGTPEPCETRSENTCDYGCEWTPGLEPMDCWWVQDHVTEIVIDCDDTGDHPVEQESACFRVGFDQQPWLTKSYCALVFGEMQGPDDDDWCCAYVGDDMFNVNSLNVNTIPQIDRTLNFTFQEDSEHVLEYYCKDHLGNTMSPVDIEKFKVDSVPPTTTKTYVPEAYEDVNGTKYIDSHHYVHLDAVDGDLPCAVGIDENIENHPDAGTWYNVKRLTNPDNWYLCEQGCENWDGELLYPEGRFGDSFMKYMQPFNFTQESCHVISYYSVDDLGNTEKTNRQCVFVDKSAPVINKTVHGPYFYENGKEWINEKTKIEFVVEDPAPHASGLAEVKYRVTQVGNESCEFRNVCELTEGSGNWNDYNEGDMITGIDESCHLVELMATDNVGKVAHHKQCMYVDNTAPYPDKTVGEPKTPWDGLDAKFYDLEDFCKEDGKCWKVTVLTPISLACVDPTPHPVDHEIVCIKVELDGDDATEKYCSNYNGTIGDDGFCCLEEEIEIFRFGEVSEHNLAYYCVDVLGNNNSANIDDEKFKVEETAFEIQLNKKWNLISVPVNIIENSNDELFEDVSDTVIAVWTYNSSSGDWYVYTPDGDDTNDNLDTLQPGYGYWVLSDDDDMLVIGGSLLSPVTVPPLKEIVEGWNLIGYYDADGETGYYGPQENGKRVYCAMAETDWSALYSYWEPLNPKMWFTHHSDKKGLNGFDRMDPGAGYWVLAHEESLYGPTTKC